MIPAVAGRPVSPFGQASDVNAKNAAVPFPGVNPVHVRQAIRANVFSMDKHELIKEVQMPTLSNRRITASYLAGLLADLSFIEEALAESGVRMPSLSILSRAAAIRQDIEAMGPAEPPSHLVHQFQHREHLESIRDRPALLLAHLSVHYLGFLSGGLMLAPKYASHFGEEAVHLYRFPGQQPHLLQQQFLNEMAKAIEGADQGEFDREVQTAWEFACDLFGRDIRPKLSCCFCIQRVWSRIWGVLSGQKVDPRKKALQFSASREGFGG